MATYPDIQQHSFLRSPSWRWERAHHLICTGRYATKGRDDNDTRRAVHYLRREQRCLPDRRSQVLGRDFPDLYLAHRLHEQAGPRRAEVQARLLASQTMLTVALRVGLMPEVIATYEKNFFNVLDRLDVPDWITKYAIGWRDFDPTQGRDAETVLRAFGYWGGPHVLNATIPYLLGGRMQEPPAADPTTPEGRRDRSIRLAIWSEMLPWDEKTDRLLLKLGTLLHEQHRMALLARQIGPPMAPSVAEILAACAPDSLPRAAPMALQPAQEPPARAIRQCG
jgi:hypothetical protein